MAQFLFLLFLLSEVSSDVPVVPVHPGQDAILPCQAADSSIRAVEWTKPDLKPDNVLLYSDGYFETDEQNPSFKDRVKLVDRYLNMSLILRNVTINDKGIYECRVTSVTSAGSRHMKRAILDSEPIRILLQVTDPGSKDGNSSPVGRYVGLAAGVTGVLILVATAVGGVLMYKRRKDKRPGPPAAADYEASPFHES